MPATIAIVAKKCDSKQILIDECKNHLRRLNNELIAKQNTVAAIQYNNKKMDKIEASVYSTGEHLLPGSGIFSNSTIQNTENSIGIIPCMNQPNQSIHDFMPTIFMSSYEKVINIFLLFSLH